MAEAEAVSRPVLKKLRQTRMQRAEIGRTQWLVEAEANTCPADLLSPAYWGNVGMQLNARDHIEVWAEDGAWYCELLVRACDRTWAKVHLLRQELFDQAEDTALPGATEDYQVLWRNPHRKWSVMRKADKQVLVENLKTSDDAYAWMRRYERTLQK